MPMVHTCRRACCGGGSRSGRQYGTGHRAVEGDRCEIPDLMDRAMAAMENIYAEQGRVDYETYVRY
jgi:hypothetical protein